jgi:hypothetical protein
MSMALVVQRLPSKCQALSSIPSTATKEKRINKGSLLDLEGERKWDFFR